MDEPTSDREKHGAAPSRAMTRSDWRHFLLLMALAAALRLVGLGAFDISFHEAMHYFQFADMKGWKDVFSKFVIAYPPPFYAIQYLAHAREPSLIAFRYPSFLYGLALVALSYPLARLLVTRRRALYATLLVAVSPTCVVSSQTPTPHALFGTLALLFVLSITWVFRRFRAPPGLAGATDPSASPSAPGGLRSRGFWALAGLALFMCASYPYGVPVMTAAAIVYVVLGRRLRLRIGWPTKTLLILVGGLGLTGSLVLMALGSLSGGLVVPVVLATPLVPYLSNTIGVVVFQLTRAVAGMLGTGWCFYLFGCHIAFALITLIVFRRGWKRIRSNPIATPMLIICGTFYLCRLPQMIPIFGEIRLAWLVPPLSLILTLGLPDLSGPMERRLKIRKALLWIFFPLVLAVNLPWSYLAEAANDEFGVFESKVRAMARPGDRVEIYSMIVDHNDDGGRHIYQLAYHFPEEPGLARTLAPCIYHYPDNDECREEYLAREPRHTGRTFLILIHDARSKYLRRETAFAGRKILWRWERDWPHDYTCYMELVVLAAPARPDAEDVYRAVLDAKKAEAAAIGPIDP